MKKHKNLFNNLLILFSCLIVGVLVYNIISDKYYVFSKNFSETKVLSQHFWPNERVLKTNYILSNPAKYDSFWFGSSQLNRTNVSGLKGGKWYNSNSAMMSLEEMLRILKIYKKGGVYIKSVVIQLLDATFRHRHEDYSFYGMINLIYIPYPVSIKERVEFLFWYLLDKPIINDKKIEKWFADCKYNFLDDGSCAYPPEKSTMVNVDMNNPDKFKEFPIPDYPDYSETWKEDMKNLIDFCNDNNIKTYVFIAPETYDYYQTHDKEKIKQIRNDLKTITSYWDFSGKNYVTVNHAYFFDHVHYTEKTSRKIIERIFSEKSSTKFKDNFGKYIEKSEI